MGEWVGWVYLREAQRSGVLAPFVMWFWMFVGMAASAAGTCGIISVLLDALDIEHISEKEACAEMGVSPSQWTRQKTGEYGCHASLNRVDKLPDRVKSRVGVQMVLRYGTPEDIEQIVDAAMRCHKRMLKAHYVLDDEREAVNS